MTRPTRNIPVPAPRTVIGLLALSMLAACAPDRTVTGTTYPYDYRARHPIVLKDAPRNLDVFVSAGGTLDPRQREDVHAFAAEYRRYGQGSLAAMVPSGKPGLPVHRTLGAIRTALAEAGVPGGHLSVTSYEADDPTLAAPIRLTFRRMQAKVGSRCGLWPQDLGVSDPRTNANNEPYWNLGCAMQNNVAAQVADPVDFVRGRTEGRIDTVRRTNNIEKLRDGEDPSTTYSQNKDKINQSVGN